MDKNTFLEIQKKRSRYVLKQYKEKLKSKASKELDNETLTKWVNAIWTAIIFYSIYYPNKKNGFQKKHSSINRLRQFESQNRLYTGFFETAERMVL